MTAKRKRKYRKAKARLRKMGAKASLRKKALTMRNFFEVLF